MVHSFRPPRSWLVAAVLATTIAAPGTEVLHPAAAHPQPAFTKNRMRGMPLRFEANRGQVTDVRTQFVARQGKGALFLDDEGAVLRIHGGADDAKGDQPSGATMTMKVVGGRTVRPVGTHRLDTKSNYLIGSDPAKWRVGVENYDEIT